ncbi:hypothetical protein [Agromyces arachidis]|uniref:hypothetical protein n=1 Tax=Agromyces arachidis TaxID=766966 RepID=UPI0040579BAF
MPTADIRSALRRGVEEQRGTGVPPDRADLSTAAQGRAGPAERPTPQPPALEARAAQRRTLNVVLRVACPDPAHWHAQIGVPCRTADAAHEWGWVCLPRIEHEVTTRAERQRAAAARRARAARRQWPARRAARRSAERARITALIHEAAQR